MKQIENFEKVEASTGEFENLPAGGYICRITNVEDVPFNVNTNKGDYLKIEFDIAEGKFTRYYMDAALRNDGKWWGSFIRSYKEKAQGMFKHFINCIEESNVGYKWDWQEKSLESKVIGLVLGEEEYRKNDGSIKVRLTVKDVKTVQQIKDGDYKVPALKKLAPADSAAKASFFFETVDESELPFN